MLETGPIVACDTLGALFISAIAAAGASNLMMSIAQSFC
jgi:hypothetical protein